MRPMVVAFEAALTPQDRLFLDAYEPGAVTDEMRRKPPGKGTFWCAADKPEEDDSLVLRPVYRTTKLPLDEDGHPVQCEECRIEIAALQRSMTELFKGGV